MIETDGRQYLNFKKYKMRSFNPNIKHLRIKENSLIVKLAEYEETDEVMVISVTDSFDAKTPDQVDVTDVKVLQGSKQFQIQLDTKHQKDYMQYVGCLDGQQLAENGSNAFFLVSDAQGNAEELAIAKDHELPNADDYFIGTFAPLTNYINDITGCRILLKETKGDLFPGGNVTMFLNTPEYSFLQKITGKTLTDEGEVDFKQKTHFFKDDQNVTQTKVIPVNLQGDGKVNMYMPGMDNRKILDAEDIGFLIANSGTNMLKDGVVRRTAAPDSVAQTILEAYESCTKITQAFLNDFNNYRIKQATYDGGTQDQKNKHHVGDIMPGEKIGGIEAMTIAEQKTISSATDRIIDKGRSTHPDGQEADTLDGKLYICLQKLLSACSTHCVTRFSVEADMTEKHRYYLPYYLTVSLPVNPDTAFKYGVAHNIKSAGYDTANAYKEKLDIKLSTPYVANLEETEVEPLLPETLVAESLNKIAGSLSKGTEDYLKYVVHTPNDHATGIYTQTLTGQLSVNNHELGATSVGTVTVTKKIPTTKGQGNNLQPFGYGYTGKAYIIPNSGGDIVSRELAGRLAFGNSDEALGKYLSVTSGDHKKKHLALYTRNPGGELTPKIVAGDIVWDSSAGRMTDTEVKGLHDKAESVIAKFFYTKDQLETNILHSLGFKTKPKGGTFKATPEIATAPNQGQKVDNINRRGAGDPFDDSSKDVKVYRGRDIEASGTIDKNIADFTVSSKPLVFDKLEGTNRRRELTGETKGIDIELSSTRTDINYTDITELYITGLGLDNLDISFSIPNFAGVNARTLDFNLETDVKYDEKISSVRILF